VVTSHKMVTSNMAEEIFLDYGSILLAENETDFTAWLLGEIERYVEETERKRKGKKKS